MNLGLADCMVVENGNILSAQPLPIRFGRAGARQAKTPVRGLAGLPLGCTRWFKDGATEQTFLCIALGLRG